MSDVLRAARILAEQGRTDELVNLLERTGQWRKEEEGTGDAPTREEVIDALGYIPAQESSTGTGEAVTLTGGDGIEPIGTLDQDRTVAVDSTVARLLQDETITGNWTFDLPSGVVNPAQGDLEITSGVGSGQVAPILTSRPDGTDIAAFGLIGQSRSVGSGFGRGAIIFQGENPDQTQLANSENITVWQNQTTQVAALDALGRLGTEGVTDPSFSLEVADDIGAVSAQGRNGYSPGWEGSGWLVDETGPDGKPDFMELSHLSVRGTLRVRELEVRQITFSKGPFGITPGGGKLETVSSSNHTINDDADIGTATAQEWTFANSNDQQTEHGLAAGDRLLAQKFDPSSQTVVAQVRAVVENVVDAFTVEVNVDQTYTVPSTGDDTTGYEFIVAASSNSGRDSIIYFDPYDPSGSAFDGLSSFNDWDNRANFVRYRDGNLNGYFGFTADTYGMAAGDPSNENIAVEPSGGVQIRDGSTTLAQLSGTSLELGTAGQIIFDPTASIEAQIAGTLEVSSGGLLRAISGSNEWEVDPATPIERFYQGGELAAVFTTEKNPSYSPTKTDDIFEDTSGTTGPYTYSVSGDGIWVSGSFTVKNLNPTSSETVSIEVRDGAGNVLLSRQRSIAADSTTTFFDTFKATNVTTLEVEETSSSGGLQEIDMEIYKPLTVISRRGVRTYKTASTFDSLGE